MSAGERTALWVVPVADLAGVARHVLDTFAVRIPGWRLVLLCPPGPLADQVRAGGGAALTAPIGPAYGLRESRSSIADAARTIRPAIVHSHLSYADVAVALTRLPRGTSTISTEHGIAADDEVYHSGPLEAAAMARAHQARLHRLDALVAVSEATLETVVHKWHPPARLALQVIRNGVDAPTTPPTRRRGLRICSIARLAPEKRIPELLLGFAQLLAEEPSATLTIAGEGPQRTSLEELSNALGVAPAVTFLGHADPAAVLAESDVLAQLSVWENCSYSLLDAVAAGLGVVASAVGGNPEMLPPTALVADVEPSTIAHAMRRQGLELTARPALPDHWPNRTEMTASLAQVYAAARARRAR